MSRGNVIVGEEPAITAYSVAIGVGSVMGQVFNARTRFVRLQTDIACSVEFGLLPSAVSGNGSMAAGQTEYFGVLNSASHRVAVIQE